MNSEKTPNAAPVDDFVRMPYVFGSIDIGAELAAGMGMDPRPYLSEEQIAEQLRISKMSREQWDAEWDRRLSPPF